MMTALQPKHTYAQQRKIKKIHHNIQKTHPSELSPTSWLHHFFWDQHTKNQVSTYLQHQQKSQGPIQKIITQHPIWTERPPLHLPYIYQHELIFTQKKSQFLFQKYNYSYSLPTLLSTIFSTFIPKLSPTFRKHHHTWEHTNQPHPYFSKLNPSDLWKRYITFLHHYGHYWKKPVPHSLGPSWIIAQNTMTLTKAIHDKHRHIGPSLKNLLLQTLNHYIHQHTHQEKKLHHYGTLLATAINTWHNQHTAIIDINLGNFILDHHQKLRLIDGELYTLFPQNTPAHYKSMELALLMGILFLETTPHYCTTINSQAKNDINHYQQAITILFTSLLQTLEYETKELQNTLTIYQDTSSKISHLLFHTFFCLRYNSHTIQHYQKLLAYNLLTTLKKHL